MSITLDTVNWGSAPNIGVTLAYDSQRSGQDMRYRIYASLAPVTGGSYFGSPVYISLYLDGDCAVSGGTVKAASPDRWSSAIEYDSGWITVSGKSGGTTALTVRLYSGSGSSRDQRYSYALDVEPGSSAEDFRLAAGDAAIGQTGTLTVTKPGSGYTFRFSYVFGGASGTLGGASLKAVSSTAAKAVYQWTAPAALAEQIPNALRGGVTTACTGPGSANVVGGTFTVLKLAGKRVDNMLLKEPAAMKCAFGENPKGCYGQGLKKSPMTRMAVAALLRELLFKTRRYRDDKLAGKNPPFDMKLEAMLPVINGEIPLKCHAHRADDILTAVRIAKEFGVKATLDHCTDGELISDELAKEGLPVFVGPTLGSKSKAELRHKSFTTPGALYHAGLTVSIITDAPVIPLEKLPMCAGLAANAGLPMEEAWRAITINPARSLGIDSRVGSLEPGKDADLVLWTADPLTTIGAEAYCTIVDGKVVYQAE